MAQNQRTEECAEDRARWIERAREEWAVPNTENLQIDDDAAISEVPEEAGCWVQAWVWVYDKEAGE